MKIELILDHECPHIQAAREALAQALERSGLDVPWQEWWIGDDDLPQRAEGYGSPTVLVDGQDVAGSKPVAGANCCRVYVSEQAFKGAPSVDLIVQALSAQGVS